MTRPSIFRQAALDRLSSPEQLDRLMQVTLPSGWFALAGVWMAVGVTILWSIFGSIPTTVSGSGIIMSSGGIREVEVLGSGVVEQLAVAEGDLVDEVPFRDCELLYHTAPQHFDLTYPAGTHDDARTRHGGGDRAEDRPEDRHAHRHPDTG